MNVIPIIDYTDLENNEEYKTILSRELAFDPEIERSVRNIIETVRTQGDKAVLDFTRRFDNVDIKSLSPVNNDVLHDLHSQVDTAFLGALREAIENVREFHLLQYRDTLNMNKADGVKLSMRFTPIASVGLYVPGGAAAYPSSIVMNAVPAQVAGVERIAVVTPPGRFRENPHIAAALVELGLTETYTIGGAQAVAALAYGTENIRRVDKIVGPGNMFVAEAKRQVYGRVDIDMVAGPSEIVVVADETANPAFAAADLLSQAEHGSGMEMAVLLTTSKEVAEKTMEELYRQVEDLSRSEDIKKVLDKNALVIVKDLDEAVGAVNRIAPEHLELMVEKPENLLSKIKNAGAIFLGAYSPEAISDYYAGPNHVLPTSGTARYASPLGVYDFQKCSSVVEYTREAVVKCAKQVDILARSEGFEAHARAVTIRCRD
ncbi:MAG: histidinol dehydrogenase [Candidatus Latescibacteria bacterium]|jgi:histidinol dehydrogenase|nr:histidinol dehydrogenase [Candidatus Latescibacterota bacterium]